MVEIPCDVCHIGLMQPRRVTYATRLGAQLLILPDIHVSICDVCGESLYDAETIARIEMLLGVDISAGAHTYHPEAAGDQPDINFQLSQRRRSA